jgi:hypothetical protein
VTPPFVPPDCEAVIEHVPGPTIVIVTGVRSPLKVPPETVHTEGLLLVKTIVNPLVTFVVALSDTGESPTTLLLKGPNVIT